LLIKPLWNLTNTCFFRWAQMTKLFPPDTWSLFFFKGITVMSPLCFSSMFLHSKWIGPLTYKVKAWCFKSSKDKDCRLQILHRYLCFLLSSQLLILTCIITIILGSALDWPHINRQYLWWKKSQNMYRKKIYIWQLPYQILQFFVIL
jgi:hypothetical protein